MGFGIPAPKRGWSFGGNSYISLLLRQSPDVFVNYKLFIQTAF
jgi:hypothetical protein